MLIILAILIIAIITIAIITIAIITIAIITIASITIALYACFPHRGCTKPAIPSHRPRLSAKLYYGDHTNPPHPHKSDLNQLNKFKLQ